MVAVLPTVEMAFSLAINHLRCTILIVDWIFIIEGAVEVAVYQIIPK